MLSKGLAATQLRNLARRGFARNAAQLSDQAKSGQWSPIDAKPEDVAKAEPAEVGSLIGALSTAPEDDSNAKELAEAVSLYFKRKFRKITFEQAADTCVEIARSQKTCELLAHSFWVWETIEESVRG